METDKLVAVDFPKQWLMDGKIRIWVKQWMCTSFPLFSEWRWRHAMCVCVELRGYRSPRAVPPHCGWVPSVSNAVTASSVRSWQSAGRVPARRRVRQSCRYEHAASCRPVQPCGNDADESWYATAWHTSAVHRLPWSWRGVGDIWRSTCWNGVTCSTHAAGSALGHRASGNNHPL